MQLSRFNINGLNAFQTLLDNIRGGLVVQMPLKIIEDNSFVEPFNSSQDIAVQVFDTRLNMAAYLNPILVKSLTGDDMTDTGLWAWLSAVFFDTVCPTDENGRRNPQADYRHIPSPDWRHFYRHLIRGPVRAFRIFESNLERAAIVLCQHPASPGDFAEQLGSRQERITNPAIIDAANQLYFDQKTKKPKRGASPNWPKAGTLRRYTSLLDQLDLTYDLYSMSADDILNVLPDEFAPYRK